MIHTHTISNGSTEAEITSTHHQMQYPWTINNDYFDILYHAYPSRSRFYFGIDDMRNPNVEPEIVYYHVPDKPKCLAIQGHPEMMRKEAPIINILNKLISTCLSDVR